MFFCLSLSPLRLVALMQADLFLLPAHVLKLKLFTHFLTPHNVRTISSKHCRSTQNRILSVLDLFSPPENTRRIHEAKHGSQKNVRFSCSKKKTNNKPRLLFYKKSQEVSLSSISAAFTTQFSSVQAPVKTMQPLAGPAAFTQRQPHDRNIINTPTRSL